MWTNEILAVMLSDCVSASVLTGVYSIDTLPILVTAPAALIINLDKSFSTGTHWVAIFIDHKKKGFYFDSLGRTPPKQIVTFLKRNCIRYSINHIKYQHNNSMNCGLFCIVYIYFATRGKNILKHFYTTHLKRNDTLVKKYITQIVNTKQKCV